MTEKLLCLTISHHLFLTKDQRYKIADNDEFNIEVVGISNPVWCYVSPKKADKILTDEPSQEIFCKYKIYSKSTSPIVAKKKKYHISLSKSNIRQHLKDKEDGGQEMLTFQHYSKIKLKEKFVRAVHFVIIKDIDELNKTCNA